jgi:predicted nucleic acid-binding protein
MTLVITMTELLVKPYLVSDEESANKGYPVLSTYPHLEWISPILEIADRAAKIRAIHGLRTPDALQAATALHRATMLSNDPILNVPGFAALVLDDYV